MEDCLVREIDVVDLTQQLVRCPSITPDEAGTLEIIGDILTALGFECHRLRFADAAGSNYDAGGGAVSNLYARSGSQSPNFCFAGHVDVVPPGDVSGWSVDPFAAVIREGCLWGRGVADMKGGIAAFLAALGNFLATDLPSGSISCLVTSDEEGTAVNGTQRVLAWLAEQQQMLDVCLLGEPTNPTALGEMVKVGRKGSFNACLTVYGQQGHSAYLQDNPAARLVLMLADLDREQLDGGSEYFLPSSVAITSIDVGNPTRNMTPASAQALFNVRFSDQHTPVSLEARLREIFDRQGLGRYDLKWSCNSPCFLGASDELTELVCSAVERVLGRRPRTSTAGGTSDGRFIKDFCPVIEFGLSSATIHQVDERTPLDDLYRLSDIYSEILRSYFAAT